MPKRQRPCNCIKQCNAELERIGSNTRLDVPFMFNMKTGQPDIQQRIKIATIKADSKSRKPMTPLFCTYCPICGKKYDV